MESTTREGVQEFIRACDTLAEFAHHHIGLTEEEREIVVVNFVRALEQVIAPSHPLINRLRSIPSTAGPGRRAIGHPVSQRAPDRLTGYQRTSTAPSAPSETDPALAG